MNDLFVSIALHDINHLSQMVSAFVCGRQGAKYNQCGYTTESHSRCLYFLTSLTVLHHVMCEIGVEC